MYLVVLDQRLDAIGIGHIHLYEAEAVQRLEIGEPRGFQRRIIIIVEVIDPDYRFPSLHEPGRDGMADETGGSGYQNGRNVGIRHDGSR